MLKNRIRDFLSRFDISIRHLYVMYFCIFFLPLLLTSLLSGRAIRQLENQLQKTGSAMTRQTQTVVDSRMEDVTILLDQINNHSTIRYLLNRKGELSAADRYRFLTIIQDLRKQYTQATMLEDAFIYMKNTDSVVSTRSRSDSRFFYENYYSYEGIDYETWMNRYMLEAQDVSVIPARNVFNGVSTRRLITIMQSLPRGSGEYQTGTAVLFLNADWLLSQITAGGDYARSVYVFSESGDIIVSSDDTEGLPVRFSSFTEKDGMYTLSASSGDYQVTYIKSPMSGWTYAMAISRDQFYSPVYRLRMLTIAALAVVSIIGVALIVLMAFFSSIPATTALVALRDQHAGSPDYEHRISMRDIGAFVQQAIDDQSMYQKQLPLLIENYVYKLMHGSRDVESELSLVSEVLGFRFPTNQFAVLAFHLEGAEDQLSGLRLVIDEIAEAGDAGMNLYMTIAARDTVAVLASFWAGLNTEYRTLLTRTAERLRSGVSSLSGAAPDIGISLVSDNHKKISKLYREALMCLAGLHASHNGEIVFYADVARLVPPSDYSFSLSVEKSLIACVCTGDTVRMNRLLDEIFQTHEQEARMIDGMTQCLKFDMIGTILRCAQEINKDDAYEQANWEEVQRLMTLENPDEIYESVRKTFFSLANRAYVTRNSHNDDMRDRMLEYLAKNYSNPDMGLDMAARAFGIAPSYLSRFFKEQTGGNFLDHVNRLRVEHAAQLLRTTDLPYAKVAEECGLSGSQALNRVFNRVLGVSPSVYRQLARQGRLDIQNQNQAPESP